MSLGSLLLLAFAAGSIGCAVMTVATGCDERARARWMLATSVALAAVFALIGAVPLALALLFVAAGQGLVTLHAIGVVEAGDERIDSEAAPARVAASHWMFIVLGIMGGVMLANALGTALVAASDAAVDSSHTPLAGFAEVASVVLVDHGFATILVALLLLAVTVMAGFLASRKEG